MSNMWCYFCKKNFDGLCMCLLGPAHTLLPLGQLLYLENKILHSMYSTILFEAAVLNFIFTIKVPRTAKIQSESCFSAHVEPYAGFI